MALRCRGHFFFELCLFLSFLTLTYGRDWVITNLSMVMMKNKDEMEDNMNQNLVTLETVVAAINTYETKAICFPYLKEGATKPDFRTVRDAEVVITGKNKVEMVRGFCVLRQEVRTFRIDRMLAVGPAEVEVFED